MDKNNDLIAKIKKFNKRDDRKKIETLLEDMLRKDPKNIDLWMRLAILEMDSPFYNEPKSIECLEEILKIEKDNPIALLVLADIQVRLSGKIDETLKDKLSTLTTDSPEINSMLRYAASGFYEDIDTEKREQLLKESINFYQGHVWNYVSLANLYFFQGRKDEAKELVKRALKNVKKVFEIEEWEPDPTDVNDLLYEFFNGIQLSSHKYELIKGKLEL